MNKSQWLLDEMRHRVSNDLSLLVSMLEAERVCATRPEEAQAFDKAIGPLMALAVYYRSLYVAPAHGMIDLGGHLERLIGALRRSYLDRLGVRIEHCFSPVKAPAGLARDLGIVVVELVGNAAKHAFPGRAGRVWVELEVEGDRLTCTVADDGVGFDLSVVERRTSGLSLVLRLVSGFDGVLELAPRSARGGAAFSVKLDLPPRRDLRQLAYAGPPTPALDWGLGTASLGPIL
jgi:two-component sensor histidine kinase